MEMMGTIRLIIWKQKIQDDTDKSGVINSKNGNEGAKNPGIGGIVGNIGNDAKKQ